MVRWTDMVEGVVLLALVILLLGADRVGDIGGAVGRVVREFHREARADAVPIPAAAAGMTMNIAVFLVPPPSAAPPPADYLPDTPPAARVQRPRALSAPGHATR